MSIKMTLEVILVNYSKIIFVIGIMYKVNCFINFRYFNLVLL